ncbi:ankyrin repeat-containing domain protein [Desarmillaria ectypa]|nr:ankyrin repeat-containing domain protein [Desarmillaria ectypa]
MTMFPLIVATELQINSNSNTHSTTRAQLNKGLDKLPRTITKSYGYLAKMDSLPNKDLAYRIFGWIALAPRPLTVLELHYALSIEPGTRQLDPADITNEDIFTSVCTGLVVIDGNRDLRLCIIPPKNVMNVLVDRGVDLQHENALCIAAHTGQLDMVKLLLSRQDVDVNQADHVVYLQPYGFEKLLKQKISRIPCTHLIAAALNGYEIVRVLLESKHMKSLNLLPPDGTTALPAAVLRNRIGVVELLLLQPGIDTESIQYKDQTPLMLAATNAPGGGGRTLVALHAAVEGRRRGNLEMLLKSGWVDANGTDSKGRSTLYIAGPSGDVQSVKISLDHTAIDITAKDSSGKSAYEIAVEKGHDDVADLLQDMEGRAQ